MPPRERVLVRPSSTAPSGIWAIDATTLEALFKKVGLLQGLPQTLLGGKLLGVLDVVTKLPVALRWDHAPSINERPLLDRFESCLPPQTLLLIDKGFFGFALFDRLTEAGIFFIIPDRQTTAFSIRQRFPTHPAITDTLIALGQYRSTPCQSHVRRIVLVVGTTRYTYLTNVTDPTVLPARDVADLYGRRWRIEDAFLLTKRLLGLAYLWTGADNGIQLQLWTTWLLYALLERISLEMVFRGLYFFVGAAQRGEAADPAADLAAQTDLGIVKRRRPPSALDTALETLS